MKTPVPVFSERCGVVACHLLLVCWWWYWWWWWWVHRGTREPGCLLRQCVGSHCFVPGKSQPSLAALLSNWQTDQRGEMPKVYSVLFQTRRPKWYRSPEKLPSSNKSCKFFKVNITKQKSCIIWPLSLSYLSGCSLLNSPTKNWRLLLL